MAHFDRVTTSQKADARDLVRLARRRGFKLKLTKQELDDPLRMRKFFAVYGDPPSDSQFSLAKQIADYLGQVLSVEHAMNKWHCRKFILDHKIQIPTGLPSEKQIRLAEQVAQFFKVKLPPEVCVSLEKWERFMKEQLWPTRDELHEIEFALNIKIEMSSYGEIFRNLLKYRDILKSKDRLLDEKRRRIRDLLLRKQSPYNLEDDFDVPNNVVWQEVRKLEAEGHELIY